MYFLVLEEDSPNLEDLPFRVDFCVSDLGDDLEELSRPAKSISSFNFSFGFPVNVQTTNAYFFDLGPKTSIVEWKVEEKI